MCLRHDMAELIARDLLAPKNPFELFVDPTSSRNFGQSQGMQANSGRCDNIDTFCRFRYDGLYIVTSVSWPVLVATCVLIFSCSVN